MGPWGCRRQPGGTEYKRKPQAELYASCYPKYRSSDFAFYPFSWSASEGFSTASGSFQRTCRSIRLRHLTVRGMLAVEVSPLTVVAVTVMV